MKRQVILRGASTIESDSGCVDPGTSPYPWANTPSVTLFDAFSDGLNSTYAYCMGTTGQTHRIGLAKGPTLAKFDKVTLAAGFDYSNAGPNVFWFPPNNSYGPSMTLQVRGRDLVTWHNGTGYSIIESDPYFVNTNIDGAGTFRLKDLTWELTAHPEGGPWTLEDINQLGVGVVINWSPGPNGLPYDTASARWPKIRIPYLTVTLDVEDLGFFIDNVRFAASLISRLMRRPRTSILSKTLADKAPSPLGSRVYLSHPRGPAIGGAGWGMRRLERRSGLVLARKIQPESFTVEDEAMDLRAFACLCWAAYRIDGPWGPELQGLALVDKGKGFTHARAQDSWSKRPGDGALMRVLQDYPNLSPEGLAVSGGGDVSVCLRNYDLMQSGWSTVGSSGDFGATTDATIALAQEQGYLTSCKLAYGAGGGAGGRERSLGTFPRSGGDRLHARVIIRNTSIPTPATQFGEFYLKRSGGGLASPEYWDEAGRAWTTTPTYLAIPNLDAVGEPLPAGEVVLDAVPCDAAGASSDPTYAIGVGRFSSSMGPGTLHGAIVDVQHTDSTVAGARPALVTLDATITRVEDSHHMPNAWGRDIWVHDRGTAVVEARPWWRAADLPADAVKPLLHAQHATNTWQALQFVPKTGSDDLVRFEAAIDGEATYQLDCPLTGLDLTRLHVLRAWARWLGADGWTEYGPYSVEVGWAAFLAADGSLVGQGSVVGRLASETSVPYARDYLGVGCDEAGRQFDGWVRMLEVRRNPLHRLECVWKV